MSFECEFCHRQFQREKSISVHVCEQKRRRLERHERGVELALGGYVRFYEITQGSARTRDFEDFCSSAYYRAFVRWGRYCVNTRVINPSQYLEWLLRNSHGIDTWTQDSLYTRYLVYYLRNENAADALARAVEWSMSWGEENGALPRDCLRYGNTNAVCHAITTGRLSAWVLYNSESGRGFLSGLQPQQAEMIWDYIDADFWKKRFRDYGSDTTYVQEILIQAGW